MLHMKFQAIAQLGLEKKDFLRIFTIYGHCGHLAHVTQTICVNFHSCAVLPFVLIFILVLYSHKLSHELWFQTI